MHAKRCNTRPQNRLHHNSLRLRGSHCHCCASTVQGSSDNLAEHFQQKSGIVPSLSSDKDQAELYLDERQTNYG